MQSATEKLMNEFNSIMGFNKIIFENKEVDAFDESIVHSMRIKLVLNEQIFSLFIKLPSEYPSQPLTFSYGNLKNVEESNAQRSIQQANMAAKSMADKGQPHL